ncbi:MAG: SURF1 family protein [Kangiellaceae bacterium]|nr:SURF1 family protein [Kangiellaceae bacterium]
MAKPLFQIKIGQKIFAPSLVPTLGFLLLLPVLIKLGLWQMARSEEKRQILANLEQKSQQAPMSLEPALRQEKPDQSPVIVHGKPVPDVHFVVDNQKHEGRLGYEVYAVWQLESALPTGESYLLISRGWLPRKDFYQQVPDIPNFDDEDIKGHLYFSKGANQVVANNAQWKKVDDSWLIGQFDLQTVAEKAKQIGYHSAPFVIRQQAESGSPFVRQWQWISSPPEKHIAYAVQWFGMALVLIILFFVLNLKRVRDHESASS